MVPFCRVCLAAVYAIAFAPASFAQLPPETSLPTLYVDDSQESLPSESSLPGAQARANADEQSGDAQKTTVPPENALPGGSEKAKNPDADSRAIGDSFDDLSRPILRLDYEGHTARVRTLALSDRGDYLASAGDDKNIIVWRRNPGDPGAWIHHRTIRWQVGRGPRGRIYSLAYKRTLVAVAGTGAMGGTGEIYLFDVVTGQLVQTLIDVDRGHRQVIGKLAWAPGDTAVLASHDLDGQVMTWRRDGDTGLWSGKTIIPRDVETQDADTAKRLGEYRGFASMTFRSASELIVPVFSRFDEEQGQLRRATWALKRFDLVSGKSRVIENSAIVGNIRFLSCSRRGDRLACGVDDQTVRLWRFDELGNVDAVTKIQVGAVPTSARFDASGVRLVVGTEIVPTFKISRLQVWGLGQAQPAFVGEALPGGHVADCEWTNQPRQLIAAVGSSIQTFTLDRVGIPSRQPARVLNARTSGVRGVAFAEDQPYRILIARQGDGQAEEPQPEFFDLNEVSLLGKSSGNAKWMSAQRLGEKWTVRSERLNGETRFRLVAGGNDRGWLPLKTVDHGVPNSIATFAGENESAVVVGTTGRGNIYVYAADENDPPRLLRQFRDHVGSVTSVQASHDGRYLVSGSDDATVCVWNLQGIFDLPEIVNKWGADFEVQDGKLIATDVREDGPLYFRGVRNGDHLRGISWEPDGDVSEPEKIRAALQSVAFDKMVSFRFTRFGRAQSVINSYAAWRPLATLLVDRDREWAFWTPAGYYDASFNGHQRFGWQINRGVQLLPDYFRAAQFRKSLERPDVMRRLLQSGSLPAAMRKSLSRIEPPPGESAIVNQYLTKPRIQLVSPQSGEILREGLMTVVADITIPLGTQLVSAKAFASGVPPVSTKEVSLEVDSSGRFSTQRLEWHFRLPSDRQIQLEIIAATDSESIDRVSRILPNESAIDPTQKPRLHLLAMGVGDYRDPQIQSLDFAADATGALARTLKQRAGGLYSVSVEQLIDKDATRPLWRIYARTAAEKLAQTVSPDDLVVMYLCGHGVRDRRTDQWYFVTADANYRDLMNDQYRDCLSFDDLALLSSLPCRKLAVIDSCHSGAVQPVMRDDDLKSALRYLQNDMVITLTASEGDEEAAEVRESGLGRFTTRLIKALEGEADSDGDQKVSLREVVDYVVRTVAADSEADGMSQHPTASPARLLRAIELPLSRLVE